MLQQIVDQFNKAFEFWQKDSGCVASFQWDYREGKEMQIKAVQALEMAQVDQILYRREAPSENVIRDALNNARLHPENS